METLLRQITEKHDAKLQPAADAADFAASRYYLLEAKLWRVQAGLDTDPSEDANR
jgi:hypothetical protein